MKQGSEKYFQGGKWTQKRKMFFRAKLKKKKKKKNPPKNKRAHVMHQKKKNKKMHSKEWYILISEMRSSYLGKVNKEIARENGNEENLLTNRIFLGITFFLNTFV